MAKRPSDQLSVHLASSEEVEQAKRLLDLALSRSEEVEQAKRLLDLDIPVRETLLKLTGIQNIDITIIGGIFKRIKRIEDYLSLSDIDEEDKVFDFDSEDFDGLEALKRMNSDAGEAIIRSSTVIDDTRRFLESRKLEPKP
ncbi:MAG: hypothetical protein RIC85_04030 [Gammaproteobacteria bacterium]